MKVTAQARTKNFVVVLSSTTCERAVSRRRDLPNFKALFLIKRCVFLSFFLVYGRLEFLFASSGDLNVPVHFS